MPLFIKLRPIQEDKNWNSSKENYKASMPVFHIFIQQT